MNNNIDIDSIARSIDIKIKEKIENIGVDIARNIPNGIIGIYIFWLKSGDAYIGMSDGWYGIRSRIRSHTREGWQRKIIERFNIYRTETIGQALDLERIMICKLKPELNSGCYLDIEGSIFLDRPEELENNYRIGNVVITCEIKDELIKGKTIDIEELDIRIVNSHTIELISDDTHANEDCLNLHRLLKRKGYVVLSRKCRITTKTDYNCKRNIFKENAWINDDSDSWL